MSVNGLVHILGWGDFQMTQIDAVTDPYPLYPKSDRQKVSGRGKLNCATSPFSNINVFVIDKQSSIYIIMKEYLISKKKVVGKRIYLLQKYCCIVDFSFLWPCQ